MQEKTQKQILASSALSVFLVSALTNPFDVVKTRLQNNSKNCEVTFLEPCDYPTKSSVKSLSTLNLLTTKNLKETYAIPCGCLPFKSNTKAFIYIIKNEGIRTLMNGWRVGVLTGLLSSTTYFNLYEAFRKEIKQHTTNKLYLPLLSSLFARTLTTSLIFPLEYWRTLQQNVVGVNTKAGYKLGTSVHVGYMSLLQRDLIFSCIYWVLAENVRDRVKHILQEEENGYHNRQVLLISNFIAGAFSGGFSSAITTPLDTIKTRRQIDPVRYKGKGNYEVISEIIEKEGLGRLYLGVRQRITKATLSCAGMLTFYEFFSHLFQTYNLLD